jgi:hypothetical protein
MKTPLRAKRLVERADDLLVNGHLRPGRKTIPGWDITTGHCEAAEFRTCPAGTVIGSTEIGYMDLSQAVRAYPNRRYRLDVHIEPYGRARGRAAVRHPGLLADTDPVPDCRVQIRFVGCKRQDEIRSYEPPPIQVGTDGTPIHRTYFQCPACTSRLRIHLRFHVTQPVVVKRVRLVSCGDYLQVSHAMANLPEPRQEPPPCVPEDVVLCDGRRHNRPLLRWLQGLFGTGHVRRATPAALQEAISKPRHGQASYPWPPRPKGLKPSPDARGHAELPDKALLQSRLIQPGGEHGTRQDNVDRLPAIVIDLPADRAPALADLLRWSDSTIVIVSLATFAASATKAGLKGIRVQDRVSGIDMPCARVVLSGFHTQGFALADVFGYAWNDGQGDFAHRYLTLPKASTARLAKEWNLRPTLVTDCGQTQADNHPLAFHRQGEHGALLVMDPDGLETSSAGEEVPRTFDLLWQAALGQATITLGQFSASPTHYEGILVDLVEVVKYYDLIEDISILNRMHGKGNAPPTWLLPGRRSDRFAVRPILHIRTGFAESDWPAVYGLLLWLKRIALSAARNETPGRSLLQRVRILAWPLAQPQTWRGCPKDVTEPQLEPAMQKMAGRIDLRMGRGPQTTIVVPDPATRERICHALGEKGEQIRIDPTAFEKDLPFRTRRTNALICQILLPGVPSAFPGNSPRLTDAAATWLDRLAWTTAGTVRG